MKSIVPIGPSSGIGIQFQLIEPGGQVSTKSWRMNYGQQMDSTRHPQFDK